MKKKFSWAALLLCFTVFATACGTNDASNANSNNGGSQTQQENKEFTFKHKLGETTVKQNPQKVVVFDFGALDTLDKLGVNVTGVAQKSVPKYLEKYKDSKYENIGTLQEPDYEKIDQLKPDLILISGRQEKAYPELSKIAPTLYVGVDTTKYMESFKENMQRLGQIFGKESEVNAEIAKLDATIKSVKDKADASKKNALIILANEGKISAYGEGSRFGIIHDVLGIPAVDKNIKVSTHGDEISFEYITEKNPDYLFVVDRGAVVGDSAQAGAKALIENELVKKTNAYKNNNIVYLDPGFWYLSGGGLLSVSEMIDEVAKGYK
ncbi:siderophore ABC transporter substrate-binding protein [Tumebacillus lipolyticus]|uniref:Siderophore ABC transporter substrate-binding protein n=1 Tax=Tumebacillus lipolyticus TaxID=1280370 RepID=A0ABW5A3A4_9BACL